VRVAVGCSGVTVAAGTHADKIRITKVNSTNRFIDFFLFEG
jgi:hypothetical protein